MDDLLHKCVRLDKTQRTFHIGDPWNNPNSSLFLFNITASVQTGRESQDIAAQQMCFPSTQRHINSVESELWILLRDLGWALTRLNLVFPPAAGNTRFRFRVGEKDGDRLCVRSRGQKKICWEWSLLYIFLLWHSFGSMCYCLAVSNRRASLQMKIYFCVFNHLHTQSYPTYLTNIHSALNVFVYLQLLTFLEDENI